MIIYDVADDHHDKYAFEHGNKCDNDNKMNKYRV